VFAVRITHLPFDVEMDDIQTAPTLGNVRDHSHPKTFYATQPLTQRNYETHATLVRLDANVDAQCRRWSLTAWGFVLCVLKLICYRKLLLMRKRFMCIQVKRHYRQKRDLVATRGHSSHMETVSAETFFFKILVLQTRSVVEDSSGKVQSRQSLIKNAVLNMEYRHEWVASICCRLGPDLGIIALRCGVGLRKQYEHLRRAA
jgi:hypothetical protein